jgi:F0F1-type ATP synthase assembly protein I
MKAWRGGTGQARNRNRVPQGRHNGAKEMKRPSMQIGLGIALGAGIGIAIDAAFGSGGTWLAIGVAIGVAIGAAMSKHKTGSASGRMGTAGPE